MLKIMILGLLFSGATWSQSTTQSAEEIKKEIDRINNDLERIKGFTVNGDTNGTFSAHTEQLKSEKNKFEKLLRRITKKKSPDLSYDDEVAKKTLPSVVRKDLEQRRNYLDETVPLEKRYDIILSEISHLYELNGRLNSIPENERSASIKESIESNNKRLVELQQLKINYEIKIRDYDIVQVNEMKKSGVRVGAMADVYYQWDFNRPQRNTDTSGEIPYKNYTNRHNDFTINLLEINLSKSYRNTDFYADIDFGEQPLQNNYLTSDGDTVTRNVGQAFLRHKFESFSNITVTAGKFYTHFGLETPKNIENRNYSRPIYYNLVCPFWHEGIALTKTDMGPFGAGIYVYDKTDKRVDNNSGKIYGAQVTFNKENLSAVLNTISGAEQDSAGETSEGKKKTEHELIVTYTVNESLQLVTDAVIGENKGYDAVSGKSTKWSALVGYVDWKFASKQGFVTRVENFRDLTSSSASNNLFTTTANPDAKAADVMAYTMTHKYNLGNGAEFRSEFRFDDANADLYPTKSGSFRRTQSTIMVGWLYSI